MKTRMLMLFSASALALAGCGGRDETANTDTANLDANMAAEGNLAIDDTAVAAAPMSAQGFANTAAASDRFEIESSQLAQVASQSQATKAYAAQMVTAHTESTAKLTTVAASLSPPVTPDPAMTAQQDQVLADLKTKSGAAFDAAYKTAQVNAHQMTLDALNAYASGGENAALKDLAKTMVPMVTAHLNTAKGLR